MEPVYLGMAVITILVLVGFGPLLVNPVGRTSPITPLTVTHSVVFGAWLALLTPASTRLRVKRRRQT
jgi:hypothetical protein